MASAGIRHGQQDFILGHEWAFTPLDQRALLAHFSKDLQSPVQVFIFVGCHVASPDKGAVRLDRRRHRRIGVNAGVEEPAPKRR